MSKFDIKCFYQHLPPYPNAGAPRAQAIVGGLTAFIARQARQVPVRVYAVSALPALGGARVVDLWARNIDNSASFAARLAGDLWLGLAAGWKMALFKRPRQSYVLISSPSFVAALVLALMARLARVRYFLDIRDIYPDVYVEAGLLKADGWPAAWLGRYVARLYRGATGIICPTQGLAQLVAARGGRDVFVAYNGFRDDLLSFPVPKRAKFTLCFHGILSIFQDVETIVELAKLLAPHEVEVAVVGYGKKLALLQSANLENVTLYGKCSHEETLRIVASCHLGLCLRRDEAISKDAFPVKVWECLGLGMPSVVTPPCEAGLFLERHGCGAQFAAGDVAALGAYVLRLKGDAGLLAQLARQARSVAPAFTHRVQGEAAAAYLFGKIDGAQAPA